MIKEKLRRSILANRKRKMTHWYKAHLMEDGVLLVPRGNRRMRTKLRTYFKLYCKRVEYLA